MANFGSRNQHRTEIWPGFVDALAALLMVIIFLVMVFVVAQFFLNHAISGRDAALERLQSQVANLAELLSLERETNEQLKTSNIILAEDLQASISIREDLSKQIATLNLQADNAENIATKLKKDLAVSLASLGTSKTTIENQLSEISVLRNDIDSLKALREELQKKISALSSNVSTKDKNLLAEKKLSETARAQVALLNKQIRALRMQIMQVAQTLEASEKVTKRQRVKIANLGKRLNAALASKVQELSRYRSEFFGRLRDVLGSQPGIRIVGDRFVFQSEVLFSKVSDELESEGRSQIRQLAGTLKTITVEIPKNIDWVLRVDGHTDQIPIRTARFPSNWELSTARAISVVKFLIKQGIPPNNLAATGFGEFQPIDPRNTEDAYVRNRRIELKLTQR